MIRAEHLSKKYRKKVAVDDVSFTVDIGKVTGFLGPNGAGKSTTMRLMLGLDNGSGYTTYDDKRLHEISQPSKTVGILLEAKAFHPTRSARSHLKVLADAGNIPHSRVDVVLDIVGRKDVAKKGPGKFSLGMSQRLGIAAAILGEPKYLLLDEPANGLDPEGIAWLRDFLKTYANSLLVRLTVSVKRNVAHGGQCHRHRQRQTYCQQINKRAVGRERPCQRIRAQQEE